MAFLRSAGSVVVRFLLFGLFAVLAVWVMWTWPWAPLAWLGILLAAVGVIALRRRSSA